MLSLPHLLALLLTSSSAFHIPDWRIAQQQADAEAANSIAKACEQTDAQIHVSPNGSDSRGNGSPQRPYASPQRAQQDVRSLLTSSNPPEKISVELLPGVYTRVLNSASTWDAAFLTLDPMLDSSPKSTVWWRSGCSPATSVDAHGAVAVWSGGVEVPNHWIEPVAGQLSAQQLMVNLTKWIPSQALDLGTLGTENGDLSDCASGSEPGVFFGSQEDVRIEEQRSPPSRFSVPGLGSFRPGTLARWPNLRGDSLTAWDLLGNASGSGTASSPYVLTLNSSRAARWTREEEPMVHAFFKYDWEDLHARILPGSPTAGRTPASTATATGSSQVTLDPSLPLYQPPTPQNRAYYYNLLSELDAPGEWFLSRQGPTRGCLFFLPPADWELATGKLVFSMGGPAVQATQATEGGSNTLQNVVFSNILSAFSRGQAAFDLSNVTASRVLLQGGGATFASADGISMPAAAQSSIVGSSFKHLGCAGARVGGGNYTTLQRADVLVAGVSALNFSSTKYTYVPGIEFEGLGLTVSRSEFGHAPHSALLGTAGDSLFLSLDIHDVAQEAADAGALYSGRSWARRNNTVANCSFTNVFDRSVIPMEGRGCQAIHLDDQMSGWSILENSFRNVYKGVQLGGGRRITIANNTFYNVSYEPVHLDDRGMGGQRTSCEAGGKFQQQLEALHYTRPPWSSHYPDLVDIWSSPQTMYPCQPAFNRLAYNTFCRAANFSNEPPTWVQQYHSVWLDNVEACPGA